ncbi:MAG: transglycosylase domain-containing protein [Acidimicrobiia bacterium]
MPPRARLLVALVLTALVAASCRYTTHLKLPDEQAVSSRILWGDGTLLTRVHGAEDRDPVKLSAMAPTLPQAVVAIEDARYYQHGGFDLRGIVRAVTHDIEQGRAAEGGSTITQQYVRAVMLGHQKSLKRKLHEAVMAMQLEDRYSKKTILERYLNTIYFGNGSYGVQAAARTYYAKDAKDLDLAQSATLAGLIRSPNDYDPFAHPDAAVARRNEVIAKMRSLHEITPQQAQIVTALPVGTVPHVSNERYPAPYFVEKVKHFIFNDPHFGATPADRERKLFEGGLTIETTLDPQYQQEAETALHGVLTDPSDPPGALVAIDPTTGHVKAYAGSLDFFDDDPNARYAQFHKLDLADARARGLDGAPTRPPGSTFKPFVLATALARGIPLSRTYQGNSPRVIPPGWGPQNPLENFDGENYGRLNLIEATVHSVNTIYGQLVMDAGPQNVASTAESMGISGPLSPVPAIAIGNDEVTLEDITSAYGVLTADGVRHPEVYVTRVTDPDGRVLYEAHPAPKRVLDTEVSRTVTGVLQQVVQRGTGTSARIGRPVAGKTGTMDRNTDAWFVGYTPELAAGVWVGEPDNHQMRPPLTRIKVIGGTFPAQIWQVFASSVLANVPASLFPAPTGSTTTTSSTSTTTRPVVPGIYSVVGLNVIAAVQELDQDGYHVVIVKAPSRRYPPDYVTAQDPPAGTPVRPGATITLTVANGRPQPTGVPSVLGMSADAAAATIRGAGLVAEVRVEVEPDPVPPDSQGKVWKQSPVSGTTIDQGSTVTIWANP